jgi:hypothetical protein
MQHGYSDLSLWYYAVFRLAAFTVANSGYSSGYSKRPFDAVALRYLLDFLEDYFSPKAQKWYWVKITLNNSVDPDSLQDALSLTAGGDAIPFGISVLPGAEMVVLSPRTAYPFSTRVTLQIERTKIRAAVGPGLFVPPCPSRS